MKLYKFQTLIPDNWGRGAWCTIGEDEDSIDTELGIIDAAIEQEQPERTEGES